MATKPRKSPSKFLWLLQDNAPFGWTIRLRRTACLPDAKTRPLHPRLQFLFPSTTITQKNVIWLAKKESAASLASVVVRSFYVFGLGQPGSVVTCQRNERTIAEAAKICTWWYFNMVPGFVLFFCDRRFESFSVLIWQVYQIVVLYQACLRIDRILCCFLVRFYSTLKRYHYVGKLRTYVMNKCVKWGKRI